jgi:hypothetical protein
MGRYAQEATVVIRVRAKTRDKLDARRKPKYGDWGGLESLADVLERVVDAYKAPTTKTSNRSS